MALNGTSTSCVTDPTSSVGKLSFFNETCFCICQCASNDVALRMRGFSIDYHQKLVTLYLMSQCITNAFVLSVCFNIGGWKELRPGGSNRETRNNGAWTCLEYCGSMNARVSTIVTQRCSTLYIHAAHAEMKEEYRANVPRLIYSSMSTRASTVVKNGDCFISFGCVSNFVALWTRRHRLSSVRIRSECR